MARNVESAQRRVPLLSLVSSSAPRDAEARFPLRGRDVLCLSSIDWDFLWQGHQQIMASLAEQGNRVLFVENTGVRSPRFSDLPRLKRRLANWWRGTQGFRQEQDRLFIYSPVMLPFPYSRTARWVNRTLLRRSLRRWMKAAGFGRPIVWTFLPTPIVLDLITEFDPVLTVYYCIDDLAHSSPAARRISETEPLLFEKADLVFVTSEKLRLRASEYSSSVHVYPFGVDFDRFAKARLESPLPADLDALPRPIAGYVGGLHRWIDQALLAEVARRRPRVTFALVGPQQTDLSLLQKLPNVKLLGARSHQDLPSCIKAFDVGLIPYLRGEYTDNVYPTKLNEYLAMGLPVVSTGLPEVRRFQQQHGPIVHVAEGPEAFIAALDAALERPSAEARARRIEVSRANGWQPRIWSMAQLLATEAEAHEAVPRRWRARLEGLYRRARRRVAVATLAVFACYALLFETSLVWLLAEPLKVQARPRRADVILVVAGGTGESLPPGVASQDRVLQAVELYRRGFARKIVFSSPLSAGFRETEVMKSLALLRGIPADAIELEERPRNTVEHAQVLGEMARSRGWRKALLVSSPYHMRRLTLTFAKMAPGLEAIPAPVQKSMFWAHDGGASLVQLQALGHELVALGYYRFKGYL